MCNSNDVGEAVVARRVYDNLLDCLSQLSWSERTSTNNVYHADVYEDFEVWTEQMIENHWWHFVGLDELQVTKIVSLYNQLNDFYLKGGQKYQERQDPRWSAIMLAAHELEHLLSQGNGGGLESP